MKIVDLLYSVTTGSERRRRLPASLGLAFAIGLLVLVVLGSLSTDRALSLQGFLPGALGTSLGLLLLAAGLTLWGWCLVLFKGKGVPFNPPPQLVVAGPYAWVRNPMLTGLSTALFGLGLILDSSSLVVVGTPAFVVLNVIELKVVEEPELARRFGASYDEYRHKVPMFAPRRPRRWGGGAPPNSQVQRRARRKRRTPADDLVAQRSVALHAGISGRGLEVACRIPCWSTKSATPLLASA